MGKKKAEPFYVIFPEAEWAEATNRGMVVRAGERENLLSGGEISEGDVLLTVTLAEVVVPNDPPVFLTPFTPKWEVD